jgi:ubiquinone/menaquinone biosynthesis C-methylase UbiE
MHAADHAPHDAPGAAPVPHDGRRGFFDGIAGGWDARIASGAFLGRLRDAVDALGLERGETVVDLGCGTGNLTRMLAERLTDGRVLAVDFSLGMLRVARRKLADHAAVDFVQADAAALPYASATADRVICFSTWPHFAHPGRVAAELARVVRPGGWVHVLHVDGRETINRIHGSAGGPIAHDLLPPADELAGLLARHGLPARTVVDEADRYRIAAQRPG